jgi:hypothetical protein
VRNLTTHCEWYACCDVVSLNVVRGSCFRDTQLVGMAVASNLL